MEIGNYLVCRKFTDTLSVGSLGAMSTSGYDGFAEGRFTRKGESLHLKANGSTLRHQGR